MRFLIFLTVLAAVSRRASSDWTCEECLEGGAKVGEFLSSPANIEAEIVLLLSEVCPQHEDPAYCTEKLPGIWTELGPLVWRTHFGHICDDREDCAVPPAQPGRSSVPSCEDCLGRVNGAADALAWEETIIAWVSGLSQDWCTGEGEGQDVEQCQAAVQWAVPLVFKALVAADRDWTFAFCVSWAACNTDIGM